MQAAAVHGYYERRPVRLLQLLGIRQPQPVLDLVIGERFPSFAPGSARGLTSSCAVRPTVRRQRQPCDVGPLANRWATLTHCAGHGQASGPFRPDCCDGSATGITVLWEIGAWDEENGKLRETMTPQSSRQSRKLYQQRPSLLGHAGLFAASLPADDPFWTAPRNPAGGARRFHHRIDEPGLLIAGHKPSGQCRSGRVPATNRKLPLEIL